MGTAPLGTSPGSQSGAVGATGAGSRLEEWRFLDASHGWALVRRGAAGSEPRVELLLTADGGDRWRTALRLASQGDAPYAATAQFMSPETGWVAATYPDHVDVYRTSDAGERWDVSTVELPGPFAAYSYVDFVSFGTGWLEVAEGGHSAAAILYQSLDGGETWSPVDSSLPSADAPDPDLTGAPVAFLDSTRGWLAGPPPVASGQHGSGYTWVARTADGGRTWSHVDLPIPDGYEDAVFGARAPVALPGGAVGIPVQLVGSDTREEFLVYESSDGGASWTVSASLKGVADGWSIVSRDLAWVHVSGAKHLYVTHDGGRTWVPTAERPILSTATNLQFLSSTDGWAQVGPAELLHTMEGARTWAAVRIVVPSQ